MKKLILIILTGLLIYGCSEKQKEQIPEKKNDQFSFDSSDIKADPVENPNEPFYLRYKLNKGTEYNFRLTSISKDNQVISSKDTTLSQGLDQTLTYNLMFTPASVDSDSTIEMQAVINSIKVDGTFGNEKIHYQSGITKDSAEIDKYAQYEALVHNPFDIRVSKLGELLDVFRTDKIVNKLLDIKGYTDSLKSDEKVTLKNDITGQVLKPMLGQIFRKLPADKMAKDLSWNVEQPVSQIMVFQTQNTSFFKIAGVKNLEGDLIADIEASSETKVSGKNKLTDRGVNYEFQEPVTSGGGKIYYNITKGLVQKSKLTTSIKLSYSFESGGQKGSKNETISNTNILEYLP